MVRWNIVKYVAWLSALPVSLAYAILILFGTGTLVFRGTALPRPNLAFRITSDPFYQIIFVIWLFAMVTPVLNVFVTTNEGSIRLGRKVAFIIVTWVSVHLVVLGILPFGLFLHDMLKWLPLQLAMVGIPLYLVFVIVSSWWVLRGGAILLWAVLVAEVLLLASILGKL